MNKEPCESPKLHILKATFAIRLFHDATVHAPSPCGKVTKRPFILEAFVLTIPAVPAPTKMSEGSAGKWKRRITG